MIPNEETPTRKAVSVDALVIEHDYEKAVAEFRTQSEAFLSAAEDPNAGINDVRLAYDRMTAAANTLVRKGRVLAQVKREVAN